MRDIFASADRLTVTEDEVVSCTAVSPKAVLDYISMAWPGAWMGFVC